MVEYWNDGIMAFGKMVYWVIGKIHLDIGAGKSNVYSPFKTNPAKDGIFDFPLFHHSIIPCI